MGRNNLPPGPGPGRPKGVPNKVTTDIREMIKASLQGVGGIEYLKRQADENPQAYMALIGKVVPKEIEATIINAVPVVPVPGPAPVVP